MNKLLKFCAAIAVGASFSSCATFNTTGYQTLDQQTTVVNLSKANFKVIKTVEGKSDQKYVFGIGGFGRKNAESNSRQDMFANADLKDNQCIINIATTTSTSQVIFVTTKRAVTTGTVIEFIPENGTVFASASSVSSTPKRVEVEDNDGRPSIRESIRMNVSETKGLIDEKTPMIERSKVKTGTKAVLKDKEYTVENVVARGSVVTINFIANKGTKNVKRTFIKCNEKDGKLYLKESPDSYEVKDIVWK